MRQLLIFGIVLLSIGSLQAQNDKTKGKTKTKTVTEKEPKLTKAQKKEYRKRAEELRKEFKENYKDPEKFSQFKKDNAEAKRKADQMNEEVSRLQKNNSTHQEQMASLKQMNDEDEKKIQELEEALRKKQQVSGKPAPAPLSIPASGTFYAVHIGELNIAALNKILESGTEMRNAGDRVYILGLFPDVRSAHLLRAKVAEMGLRYTNIVTIKNGKISR